MRQKLLPRFRAGTRFGCPPGSGWLASLLAVCLVGCGQSNAVGASTQCPLTETGQILVERIARDALWSIYWTTDFASIHERGLSLLLLGVNWGEQSTAAVSDDLSCSRPGSNAGEPFCRSALGTPPPDELSRRLDSCSRLRCASEDVALVDVYLTVRPRTTPGDRHPLTYEIPAPAGQVTYAQNPFVTYRLDLADPDMISVSARIQTDVGFTSTDGTALDLTHRGSVEGRKRGPNTEGVTIDISFSGLAPPSAALVLRAQGDHEGNLSGSVSMGSAVVGRLSGQFFDAQQAGRGIVTWEGVCAARTP